MRVSGQLLAPALFSTIRVSNRASEQDIVTQVVAKYGHNARHLSLTMDLGCLEDPLSDSEEEEEEEDEDGKPRSADWDTQALPNQTRNHLTGQTLPAVTSVTIRFTSVLDDTVEPGLEFDQDWEYLWGDTYDDDGEENLAYVEEHQKWRASLADMWQAPTENLGLRRFSLAPHRSGYTIGGPDAYYLATPMKCMPHLRELRVEDRFLDADLAAFIARRGRTILRTVELVDCFVDMYFLGPGAIDFSWKDFFDIISAAADRDGDGSQLALERFVLVRTRPVILGEDDEEARMVLEDRGLPVRPRGGIEAEYVQEMLDRVQLMLQDQKKRRLQQGLGERGDGSNDDVFSEAEILFPYVYVIDAHGVIDASLTNLYRADQGADAAACKRLMDLARVNRERRANQ
ncbi:uncharacterized protein PG986_004898 [Apiospora aurea]|uniref:Uncharacterized protein n=1 Tax=Apiospora aurea TaxID=335848 RepID=A0ABR1QHH6_9PEZI